jgi:hypothetical protein
MLVPGVTNLERISLFGVGARVELGLGARVWRVLFFGAIGSGGRGVHEKAVHNVDRPFPVHRDKAAPVRGVSLLGLGLRDTAYTYMDPHGIPSGGDWTLERSAVVLLEGTEQVTVSGCVFERVDGNAVLREMKSPDAPSPDTTAAGAPAAHCHVATAESRQYSEKPYDFPLLYKILYRSPARFSTYNIPLLFSLRYPGVLYDYPAAANLDRLTPRRGGRSCQ